MKTKLKEKLKLAILCIYRLDKPNFYLLQKSNLSQKPSERLMSKKIKNILKQTIAKCEKLEEIDTFILAEKQKCKFSPKFLQGLRYISKDTLYKSFIDENNQKIELKSSLSSLKDYLSV